MKHQTPAAGAAIADTARQRIAALDTLLREAMRDGDAATIGRLSLSRESLLVELLDAFPLERASAPQRLVLLQDLAAANDALLAEAREHLSAAAGSALEAGHSRRALAAYDAQR